jgi:hypothetical protein
LSLLQSAKLAALNLKNSGYRHQTATNFAFRFAKRFSAKDSKITHLEILKWTSKKCLVPQAGRKFLERSLKRFLFINLGEVKEKRFQQVEPGGRVLESPGTSLYLSKNVSEPAKNNFRLEDGLLSS